MAAGDARAGDRSRATLKEVARLAGVSRSTTSRVLNDHPSVRPEVRARVRRVMDDVGYVPDSVARSLRRGRSGIVGLLIPQPAATVFGDAYFAALVAAIVRAGQDRDRTVALVMVDDPLDPHPEGVAAGPSRMVERVASGGLLDGAIVTASVEDGSIPRALLRAGVPVVVIGDPGEDPVGEDGPFASVDVDNVRGGMLAGRHLARLGRRRLAILAGPDRSASARSRARGARRAAATAGMEVAVEVAATSFAVEAGRVAMADLVARGVAFDAVAAGNDALAHGAMVALRDGGRRVPDDVAVVGFDDLGPAMMAEPPLTTVRQPVDDVARAAIGLLTDLGDGHGGGARRVLDVELVVRASAPAPR